MVGGVKGVMFCIGKTVGSVPHGREGGVESDALFNTKVLTD